MSEATSASPHGATRTLPEEETKTRLLPPYNVVLANDDFHSFDFVVAVLRKVFGFQEERAHQLTLEAHKTGRSILWTGSKEVAELKVEQMSTHHEIHASGTKLGPLSTWIEPAS